MKRFTSIALLLCVCLGCFGLTGCALFPDIGAAAKVAVEAKENYEKAGVYLKAAYEKLVVIKNDYDAAMKAGEKDKAALLLDAGGKALAEYETALKSYDSTKTAVTASIKAVQDAEGAQKYGMGILSILMGGLGLAGGIFGGRFPLIKQIGDLTGGILKTMAAADTHLPPANYEAFANDAAKSMTPKEFSAFNAAAGPVAIDPAWIAGAATAKP